MSKLVGTLKEGARPFTGQIIITALNGSVESYGVKSGKPMQGGWHEARITSV